MAPVQPLELRAPLPGEVGFVSQMLVAACFPPGRPLPTVVEALAKPHAARWLQPPPGPPDVSVVALRGGRLVGAAVGRRFANAEPGWGAIHADTPELAIAVVEEERGRGGGTALLRAYQEEVIARGWPGSSLTVSVQNPIAVRLYRRAGFQELSRDRRRILMCWTRVT